MSKKAPNTMKKYLPEDGKSSFCWWTVVQNHTFADRQQCRKKHPQRPHFGEVFGTKIVLRSTKFILETDSKNQSIFNLPFNRFLLDLGAEMAPRWHQDGAKMTPRWRPDAAQNLSLFQDDPKTSPDFDFPRFWTLQGSIFQSILVYFLYFKPS